MEDQDTILVCSNCDCEIEEEDLQEFDGDLYCQECFNDSFCGCTICNEYVPLDDTTYVESTDEYVCEQCLDDKFVRCDDCDTYVSRDESYYIESCERSICVSCRDNYFYCESCCTDYHNDDYAGDGYCTNCYEENMNGLHDYAYKPYPVFYGKSDLYFGIELEVESNGNDIASIVDDLPDFTYAKQDGSLDDGFEIVSHPASWDWLMGNKEKWEGILTIRGEGFSSYNTNTCGIHIHMSKKAFSGLHLYKFLKMFYENPSFILVISRRRKTNLEQYASLESDESIVYKARSKNNGTTSRYTAVNLENHATIEIRIFRGTLAPKGFWRNIEFCKAVFDYTKDVSIKDVSVNKFCDYVVGRQKDFPNLYQFLCDKDYLPSLFNKGGSKCV